MGFTLVHYPTFVNGHLLLVTTLLERPSCFVDVFKPLNWVIQIVVCYCEGNDKL